MQQITNKQPIFRCELILNEAVKIKTNRIIKILVGEELYFTCLDKLFSNIREKERNFAIIRVAIKSDYWKRW